ILLSADGKEVTVPFQQCDNDLDSEWTPRYSVGEEVPVRFPRDRPEEALPEEDACPGPWEPWLVLLFGGGLSGASLGLMTGRPMLSFASFAVVGLVPVLLLVRYFRG